MRYLPRSWTPEHNSAMSASTTASTDDAACAWGSQVLSRVYPDSRRYAATLARIWRMTEPLAVVLATAIILLIILWAAYIHVHNRHFTGFLEIGLKYSQKIGLQAMHTSPYGYDGQFYYFLARNPHYAIVCAHGNTGCPIDDPAERMQRILFPLTAKIISLGHVSLLPIAFLLINFVSILVTVAVVSQMFAEAGMSRWLGIAAGLYSGQVLGLLRDVSEPFGVMWFVLTIYLLQRRRVVLASVCAAAALLTREQFIIFLPLLTLPWILERRWSVLVQSALIAAGPFVVWQVVLRQLYGQWALIQSSRSAPLVPLPFLSLWHLRTSDQFTLTVTCVALPMIAVAVLSVGALWLDGPGVFLRDPIPLTVLTYCLLMSVTSVANWADIWAAGRLASPAMILGLTVARKASGARAASLATLLVMSCIAPATLVW